MLTARLSSPLIVFDIGNVLLRFSLDRARENFDRVEPGVGDALVRVLWRTKLGRAFECGRHSGRGLFQRVKTRVGFRMAYGRFRSAFCRIFDPIHGNLLLLARLSRRYPTAILSNTNAIHWPHMLKTYPALRRARWPLGSHMLGHMKPCPEAYRELARRTGFAFRDMVYVDDHPSFVRRARSLGIRAQCYTGERPLSELLELEGVR